MIGIRIPSLSIPEPLREMMAGEDGGRRKNLQRRGAADPVQGSNVEILLQGQAREGTVHSNSGALKSGQTGWKKRAFLI